MRGAHPEIVQALVESNMEPCAGYGFDRHSERARQLIMQACGLRPDDGAEVFLTVGGTQTNAVVLDALLRPWEGVICAETGHIAVHESGAVEAMGHKVIPLASADGKVSAGQLDEYLRHFFADDTYEHMPQPGAVYISQPTELGTLYSLAELERIADVCRRYSLRLYADGARLIYALASPRNDVQLADLARLCDAFYIGGTKAGLLLGEAVVTANRRLFPHFFTQMKRHGAVLAKGRVAGVQFERLFTDGLFRRIGECGVSTALKLREGFEKYGYETLYDSWTNQQFFRLPTAHADALAREAGFSLWGPPDNDFTNVRFVTDWSTTADDVQRLLQIVGRLNDVTPE